MQNKVYGTDRITGLDSQTAPHLLDDGTLQQAQNVNWDLYGATKPEKGDATLFSTADMHGIGVAYVDGDAYRIIKTWGGAEGYLFKNETLLTDQWEQNADDIRVVQGRGEAIIYDGTNARVWDGDMVRSLGTLPGLDNTTYDPSKEYGKVIRVDWEYEAIASITQYLSTDLALITTTGTHTFQTGDIVVFDSMAGSVYLEDKSSVITVRSNTEFTLDDIELLEIDDYLSFSSGNAWYNSRGEAGTWKYMYTHTITLPNGNVIESAPRKIQEWYTQDEYVTSGYNMQPVFIRVLGVSATDVTDYVLDDGTQSLGTDYTVGVRVYRTKDADTTDSYYLVKEFDHADAYEPALGYIEFYDQVYDDRVGALWTDGLDGAADSHDNPPVARLIVPFAGRMYVVDDANPNQIFPSMLDNYNYYGSAFYFPRDTDIVAMGVLDDRMLVIGQGRAWVHTNTDGIGLWDDIVLPVYPANQEAVVSTPYGLLLATNLGLYHWDGTGCTMLSAPVKDDWQTASVGEWHGAFLGDEAFFTNVDYTGDLAFSLKMTGVSTATERNVTMSVWRRITGHYDGVTADPYNGEFYAQKTTGFYTLYGSASDRTVTIQTKEYGGFRSGQTEKFALDLAPGATYAVTMTTGLGYTDTVTVTNTYDSRRLIYGNFAQLQGEYWSLTMVGTGTIYGWIVGMTQSNARF
jgi:hypothetical protein